MTGDQTERIAILDFGAQYGKIIDRRVREHRVLSDMFPLQTTADEIMQKGNFKGIIISGGPNSVWKEGAPHVDDSIFDCGLPVLGICYGFQLLNKHFGGGVTRESLRADGQSEVEIDPSCPLFDSLATTEKLLLTHGDSVSDTTVAPGFKVVARSRAHVAGISNDDRKLYGVQFHPEVDLSVNGAKIFDNFLYKVCGCTGDYSMESREEACIAEIRSIVGEKQKVLVMVSGGVDSTVCAALLHRALGAERVTAVHIDNGFMRFHESAAVVESLNAINLKVHHFKCAEQFYKGKVNGRNGDGQTLDQTTEPEAKRQIIGNTFIHVKDDVMEELKLDADQYFLAQGTLRPDLIESASALASGHADTIKTHHNDTALVRELRDKGRVVEPLRDFHKDEVRQLGRDLGLPEEIVERQPFPGPGLAIRILAAEGPYMCDDFPSTQIRLSQIVRLNQKAKDAEEEEARVSILPLLHGFDLATVIPAECELTATLLPIKSVGVQGDSRSYSYVAAISSDYEPIPWKGLEKLAGLIPTLLHKINRVTFVFGGSVHSRVTDLTTTHLNAETVEKIQKADKAATDTLFRHHADDAPDARHLPHVNIQQMPVVMLPVHFDRINGETSVKHSFCLRPFMTSDFMTGTAALPGRDIPEEMVHKMVDRIRTANPEGTSRVLIDLTSKPPGTTEWE
ncbi:hypothetical protein PFISCL1PPCAC_6455 [Pristionchus fissidentatus]|uniref:GMP synthase (glutamine-hydrolyzing) n=1 Tax=Pristionchus fissidentatus TaxID=1538716 RepID=A0AAV5VA82_9BILA|nr:hypothetical protein PFISCL1PPCAC_6455 [Pristionchus fissidentatus]